MFRQRIYGIACSYEDCNDFDTLCSDPLFKMAVERLPKTGAGSWPKPRRVVVKAEMMAKGYNPRFVVTNLPADNPLINGSEELYVFYTDRGDVENRTKELKNDLLSGRTSFAFCCMLQPLCYCRHCRPL